MSEFNFKVFRNEGKRFGSYTISISKNAAFGFNAGFYHRDNIKNFKYVTLAFDESKRAVAFLFFQKDPGEKGPFKIIHGKSSGSAVAHSFFKFHGIDLQKNAGRYEPTLYKNTDNGKSFYIILKA